MFWILFIFNPALIQPVDYLPSFTCVCPQEHKLHVLFSISSRPSIHWQMIDLVSETTLRFILVREEGPYPSPSPVVDSHKKGDLSFISRVHETIFINGPECSVEVHQLNLAE